MSTDDAEKVRVAVVAAIQRFGLRRVAAELTLTTETVARLAGGMRVQRGSLAIASQNVARLEHVGGTVGRGEAP